MTDETWRNIPGHRGYQASSLGRVRSVPRKLRDGRMAGGVVLVAQQDRDGYWTVKLGRSRVRVNRAVQLAFAGPPEVRHLDGDHENNRPENLAWGSRVVNERDKRNSEKGNGRGEEGKEEQDGRVIGRGSRPFTDVSEPITPITRLVRLSEAVTLGIVSCSLQALRIARHRGQLPEPEGMDGLAQLYDPQALARWDRGRSLCSLTWESSPCWPSP